MSKKAAALLAGALALTGCTGTSFMDGFRSGRSLNAGTIAAGLKEALEVGARNAVAVTSRKDGYWGSPARRIPTPAELARMAAALRSLGLGRQVEAFERKMNEAAEHAAKKAAPVFLDAIKQMTFSDARQILRGDKTAATDYFRAKTTGPLTKLYKPVVREQMEKVGAVQLYNGLLARYRKIPLVPEPRVTLDEYVTGKALAGLFMVLADEERKIRENPAARTTELLRKVFAGQ